MGGRAYFVTMCRGSRAAFLAGPFETHEQALECVDEARRLACEINALHHFDAFGTASCAAAIAPRGALNERLGIAE